MEIRENVRYMESHEWARVEGDTATVGVSDFAVEALNRDIVFVELPAVGARVKKGQSFGVIEAVKAVYDLYAPVSGRVVEINDTVNMNPGIVGQSPFDDGWLMRVKMDDPSEVESLLGPKEYAEVVEREKGKH